MKLIRAFPRAVFAMAMLGLVAFCIAHESVDLLLISGVLAAMSWYVTEGPRGRSLPRWVSNVLLVAVIVSLVVDIAKNHEPEAIMGIVGRFSTWLMLIKLYERKRARDYAQIMALSVVLALAGCMQSVQLTFAVVLLAYLLTGLYSLVLFQLYAGYERATQQRSTAPEQAARLIPPFQVSMGTAIARHVRVLVGISAAASILLSAFVFVVFPRGVWMDSSLGSGSRMGPRISGFTPEIDLRRGTNITESRREVLTAQLLDASGQPVEFKSPLLLRGAVLDRYDVETGRWRPLRRSGSHRLMPVKAHEDFVPLTPLPIEQRYPMYTLDVQMRSMAANVLFSVYAPIAVACDDRRDLTFSPTSLLLADTSFTQWSRIAHYRMRVLPFPNEETMAALSGEVKYNTAAEFPLAPVVDYAESLLRTAGITIPDSERLFENEEERWPYNRAVAKVIQDELQSRRYSYSTDLSDFSIRPGEDPIVAFLRQRYGHCEYFASAMTALCRSVGVQARLVSGYAAVEFDPTAQAYVVRESNAHAWVEVRTGPYSWTTFDPTPPSVLQSQVATQRGWADSLRWLYDRFEFQWNSRFVGFDSNTQAVFADQLNAGWGGRAGQMLQAFRDWAARVNRFFQLGPIGYIWIGMLGLIVVLGVMALMKLIRRWVELVRVARLDRLRGAEFRRLLREAGFYLDLLLILKRGGRAKPSWQTPRSYAHSLEREGHPAAAPVATLVDHFYAVRYGGTSLSADHHAQIREELDRAAKALGLRGRRAVRM